MKKTVLVLLTLLALVPVAQAMAQTPPAAPAPSTDPATARFLATLAGPQAQAPADLTPAPLFKAGCGTGPSCPTSKLCCNVCGADPGDPSNCLRCVTPVRGRCPLVA
ncbi:MAG: hypothetical protein ACJ76Y_31435 [Thermoanaerobaculia bacterium]